MSIGYLYLTRNRANDKVYVGQSGRLDAHSIENYLGSGDLMRQAIDKFGSDSFHKEILGYFDDQNSLDYAEILKIAELRKAGESLYNSGVGGPRAELAFREAMLTRFGVVPMLTQQWHEAIANAPAEVKNILSSIGEPDTDDFYRELEAQLLITQDLGSACPGCGANVDEVCRTKTGNPTRNHARR